MKSNKKTFLKLAVLCTSIIGASFAHAIEVFPIVKEIQESTPRDNFITIKSAFRPVDTDTDDKSAKQQYEFVTLELFSINNPGDEKEKLTKELGKDSPWLVFSPTRLVVPYCEMRKVRIMPMKPVEKEQLFRLRVRPSYPEDSLNPGKVRFAVGYDVLLRYLPAGTHTQSIEMKCQGNKWTVWATGNVRSEMRNLVIDGRKDQKAFNVYPDHPRVLTVNNTLAFEMNGKVQNYNSCRVKE